MLTIKVMGKGWLQEVVLPERACQDFILGKLCSLKLHLCCYYVRKPNKFLLT